MQSERGSPEPPSEPQATLPLDQREANEQLLLAALRARDEADDAHSDRKIAEDESDSLRIAAQMSERLLGSLGHDLRNPLSTILVAAELLTADDIPQESRVRLARSIIQSGQRMGRLVDQLASFTQGQLHGDLTLALAPCDLSRICWDTVQELTSLAALPIVLRTDGDLRGNWDAARVSQLLSNVVSNALELAPVGACVTVRGRKQGDWAIVEVETEADSGSEDATGHARLGLFIGREVALAHEGSLEARRDGGKVTFVLYLPCP